MWSGVVFLLDAKQLACRQAPEGASLKSNSQVDDCIMKKSHSMQF